MKQSDQASPSTFPTPSTPIRLSNADWLCECIYIYIYSYSFLMCRECFRRHFGSSHLGPRLFASGQGRHSHLRSQDQVNRILCDCMCANIRGVLFMCVVRHLARVLVCVSQDLEVLVAAAFQNMGNVYSQFRYMLCDCTNMRNLFCRHVRS